MSVSSVFYKIQRRVQHIFSLLKPPRKLTFTREGKWFVLLTLAIGSAAINTGVNLLYLVLAMMLSMIMVSGLLSEVVLRKLTLTRWLPEYVFAGNLFSYKIMLTNHKRYFPSLSLHLVDHPAQEKGRLPERSAGSSARLPERSAGSSARLPERSAGVSTHLPGIFTGYIHHVGPQQSTALYLEGIFSQRGLQEFGPVEISTRFPFGFFTKSRLLFVPASLLVLPRLGKITSFPLLGGGYTERDWDNETSARGGEGEFHNLREYRLGDNPRWIHWRSSAKHHHLLVKEFDQEQRWTVNILLDTQLSRQATVMEKAYLETAISFVTTLLLWLVERGFQVTIATYAPRLLIQTVSGGRRRAFPLLKSLALLEPVPDKNIANLYQEAYKALSTGITFLVLSGNRATVPLFSSQQKKNRLIVYDVTSPAFSEIFTL